MGAAADAFFADLDRRYATGEFTSAEWRDFWWTERATTLKLIAEMEANLVKLRVFAEKCTTHIEQVNP